MYMHALSVSIDALHLAHHSACSCGLESPFMSPQTEQVQYLCSMNVAQRLHVQPIVSGRRSVIAARSTRCKLSAAELAPRNTGDGPVPGAAVADAGRSSHGDAVSETGVRSTPQASHAR